MDNITANQPRTMAYICGGCGSENILYLDRDKNFFCNDCTGQIGYKKRTTKESSYEAR